MRINVYLTDAATDDYRYLQSRGLNASRSVQELLRILASTVREGEEDGSKLRIKDAHVVSTQ